MIPSQILRKAARLAAAGRPLLLSGAEHDAIEDYLEPVIAGPEIWTLGAPDALERSLALCFAAAIAESEGQ